MTSIFNEVNSVAGALDFHLERQNMISANIANVDTPGYSPRELVRADGDKESAFLLALKQTSANHLSLNGGSEHKNYDVLQEREAIPGNDLNYVSLDREMSRLSANTIRYQVVQRLVSKQLGMLRYAISDGRR